MVCDDKHSEIPPSPPSKGGKWLESPPFEGGFRGIGDFDTLQGTFKTSSKEKLQFWTWTRFIYLQTPYVFSASLPHQITRRNV